jgi:FkbM family methyltransferase
MSSRSTAVIRSSAPWHYRAAKWLGRRGIRGSGMWIRLAHRLGLLDCVVRYPVAPGLTIDVPLYREANWWDVQQIAEYERAVLDALAAEVRQLPPPKVFVDCGADIGLFTVGLVARCPDITSILAFEPDAEACAILAGNLARLPVPSQCHQQAVGREPGRGELVYPAQHRSQHAQYMVLTSQGGIEIVRLDDVLARQPITSPASLILKVDIEGSELAALEGTKIALAAAPRFVVVLEAHREVMNRTGIDPIECVRLLNAIRPCRQFLAERPGIVLDNDRGFFDQVTDGNVFNLIVVSLT